MSQTVQFEKINKYFIKHFNSSASRIITQVLTTIISSISATLTAMQIQNMKEVQCYNCQQYEHV
ncbi:hypothetical protein MMC16_007504 [Acarospora aff. strigata]|nr:hypothetical protein [Acarospora aff. strigata]